MNRSPKWYVLLALLVIIAIGEYSGWLNAFFIALAIGIGYLVYVLAKDESL